MRKILILTSFAVLFPALLLAKSFTLDMAHSKVSFEVTHLVISTVEGNFEKFSGSFDFNPKTRVLKNVSISIDTASVNTSQAKRDKHLKSAEFFNVEKNPTITFKSSSSVKVRKGRVVKLSGKLTLMGITKRVVLKVKYRGMNTDPRGNKKLGFDATMTLNRYDYNLKWNKKLDKGAGLLIGKKINIRIRGEAGLKK